MKILHALPALNRGGTERLVLALAAHQQQFGHSVVVATFDPLNLWPAESANLDIEEFHCSSVIHRLFRRPVHDAQEFGQFLDQWQPDVIHSHSHWTERIILACLVHPTTLIQHFHLEYEEWQRPSWYQIRLWLGRWQLCLSHLHRKTCFLAVSQATTAYYRRHLPLLLIKRLHCLPNFIVLPRRSEPRSNCRTPLRLLSVGRLVPEKQHHQLLLLAKVLQQRDFPFQLSLVGDGPLRNELETALHILGLSEHVNLCGNQNQMLTIYENADLLLHPASAEPFGLVILEAMVRGIPCLVERCSLGPRDFLSNGIGGLYVDFTDVSALASLVEHISYSSVLYHNLSATGINKAQTFDLPSYWKALEPWYRVTHRSDLSLK